MTTSFRQVHVHKLMVYHTQRVYLNGHCCETVLGERLKAKCGWIEPVRGRGTRFIHAHFFPTPRLNPAHALCCPKKQNQVARRAHEALRMRQENTRPAVWFRLLTPPDQPHNSKRKQWTQQRSVARPNTYVHARHHMIPFPPLLSLNCCHRSTVFVRQGTAITQRGSGRGNRFLRIWLL